MVYSKCVCAELNHKILETSSVQKMSRAENELPIFLIQNGGQYLISLETEQRFGYNIFVVPITRKVLDTGH